MQTKIKSDYKGTMQDNRADTTFHNWKCKSFAFVKCVERLSAFAGTDVERAVVEPGAAAVTLAYDQEVLANWRAASQLGRSDRSPLESNRRKQ